MRRWGATALALVLALPLAACSENDDATLTVLAAASLTDVFEELGAEFEEQHDVDVAFSFGSSTDLAQQVADGAPGDVLATADRASMAVAEEAGVTRAVDAFATNVLTLVTPEGNPGAVEGVEDLADVTWVRCADEVPCGKVALAVLADHDVTAEPVSLEDDVRSTLDKVRAGEVDAGLVYATDATAADVEVETVAIPGAEAHATPYLTAALAQSQQPDLASDWVAWVLSDDGRAVLAEAGFGPA